ncbi:MAG: hypothetical protein ACSHYC_02320 [Alphaproteobacteria bacterium]
MGIFRKLSRMQTMKEIPTQTLVTAEIEKVLFYQIKPETLAFFRDIGISGVPSVADTPHYKFARSILENGRQAASVEEELYRNYLQASWAGKNGDIEDRINKFADHLKVFVSSRSTSAPLLTTFLGDNDLYAVDGNHRLAFSLATKRNLEVKIAPFNKALKIFNPMKEYYGQGNKGKPYQSIYFNKRMVVTGRRVDLIERLNLIPTEAINGMEILDIASNFGMSSIMANIHGAKKCTGIEKSKELVNFSNKMSILHEREKSVHFLQHDIDHPEKPISDFYDTAFAFSIYSHLKNKKNLFEIIEKCIKKYVIFETHPHAKIEDYPELFDSKKFRSCDFLGNLNYSYDRPEKCRGLYILTR